MKKTIIIIIAVLFVIAIGTVLFLAPTYSGLACKKLMTNIYVNNQIKLGNKYSSTDFDKAIMHYESAAAQGSIYAMEKLAWLYSKDSRWLSKHNLSIAIEWQLQAAEKIASGGKKEFWREEGTPTYAEVCKLYDRGIGEVEEAALEFAYAATENKPWAMYRLSNCYVLGRGVKKDYEKGMFWDLQAIQRGSAEAQYGLGLNYYTGYPEYVEENIEKSAYYMRMAAEQGFSEAYGMVGLIYLHGYDVYGSEFGAVRDIREDEDTKNRLDQLARYWFELAATEHEPLGYFYLGVIYRDGRGVDIDETEASIRFRQAGYNEDEIFELLSPSFKNTFGSPR